MTPVADGVSCGIATCSSVPVCVSGSCVAAVPDAGGCSCSYDPLMQQLGVGAAHACKRLPSGTVECWGDNQFGALGNGTVQTSTVAVPVAGLSGVSEVTAGSVSSCAVVDGGAAYCWGANFAGDLVFGGPSLVTSPTAIALSDVAGISPSLELTCAVIADGGVYCAGRNQFGQLGAGTTNPFSEPQPFTRVASLPAAIQVVAGEYGACALTVERDVWCWGRNDTLGIPGAPSIELVPRRAVTIDGRPLSAIAEVRARGFNMCARTMFGEVLCTWTGAEQPQAASFPALREAATEFSPVRLNGCATRLGAGVSTNCATLQSGGVRCWGLSNLDGTLGTGDLLVPDSGVSSASGLTNIVEIHSVGSTCALLVDGGHRCWGRNDAGQLGDGTTLDRYAP
jgi:alpha-tubulin suppressor-like RCC1 family protein